MRIGGSLPLNRAGSFPISLAGGGYSYLPMGNYLYQLGPNTQIQWFDPILSAWRVAANQSSGGALTVDGYNYRIINVTGTIGVTTVTGAGSGAVNGIGATATGVSVSYSAPAVLGRAARGFAIVGGSLPALNVAQAGSGFTALPLILIDPPPPGGIQATAICAITGGAISSATLTNVGAGYTSIPNVYVVPQFLDFPGQLPFSFTNPPVPPNFPPGQIAGGAGPSGVGGALPPQNWAYGLQIAFPITSGALINFGASPVLGGSGTVTGITTSDGGQNYTAVAQTVTVTGAGAATATVATPVAAVNDTSFLQAFINE